LIITVQQYCAGYSKHELACIPMAAVHINTSTPQVQFSLIRVVSVPILFLGNQYK